MRQTHLLTLLSMIPITIIFFQVMHTTNQRVPMSQVFVWSLRLVEIRTHEDAWCQESLGDGAKCPLPTGLPQSHGEGL
jgi:hypothetical protein